MEEQKNHGLIEVECFTCTGISKPHKLILDKIPQKQGGIFSTRDRHGIVDKNIVHTYPKYDTVESAIRVVQMVINKYMYNALHKLIKKLYREEKMLLRNCTNFLVCCFLRFCTISLSPIWRWQGYRVAMHYF